MHVLSGAALTAEERAHTGHISPAFVTCAQGNWFTLPSGKGKLFFHDDDLDRGDGLFSEKYTSTCSICIPNQLREYNG
jgi:hypothetical protein